MKSSPRAKCNLPNRRSPACSDVTVTPLCYRAFVNDSDIARPVDLEPSICISCEDCVMQGTDACKDCLVTFVVAHQPGDAVVIDMVEAKAIRRMSRLGLVSPIRHRSSASANPASPGSEEAPRGLRAMS